MVNKLWKELFSQRSQRDIRAISARQDSNQPIGLVHGMQTACNASRQKVSAKSRSVIKDISLCDCDAASAPTESMLQQHTELCASASSKTINFHRNKNVAEAKKERLLTRTA